MGAGLVIARPEMPQEWRDIRPGLTRDEVGHMIPDRIVDMCDIKGFDVAYRTRQWLGMRYTWILVISYENDLVRDARAHTNNNLTGWLDRSPWSVQDER